MPIKDGNASAPVPIWLLYNITMWLSQIRQSRRWVDTVKPCKGIVMIIHVGHDRPCEVEPDALLFVESYGIILFDIDRMRRSGERGCFLFLSVGEARDMVLFLSEQGNSQWGQCPVPFGPFSHYIYDNDEWDQIEIWKLQQLNIRITHFCQSLVHSPYCTIPISFINKNLLYPIPGEQAWPPQATLHQYMRNCDPCPTHSLSTSDEEMRSGILTDAGDSEPRLRLNLKLYSGSSSMLPSSRGDSKLEEVLIGEQVHLRWSLQSSFCS